MRADLIAPSPIEIREAIHSPEVVGSKRHHSAGVVVEEHVVAHLVDRWGQMVHVARAQVQVAQVFGHEVHVVEHEAVERPLPERAFGVRALRLSFRVVLEHLEKADVQEHCTIELRRTRLFYHEYSTTVTMINCSNDKINSADNLCGIRVSREYSTVLVEPMILLKHSLRIN